MNYRELNDPVATACVRNAAIGIKAMQIVRNPCTANDRMMMMMRMMRRTANVPKDYDENEQVEENDGDDDDNV